MSKENKKVLAVGYAHGRVGSSAMMGILDIIGYSCGKESRLSGPSSMNPKGFYELHSHNIFLEVAYPDIYGELSSPPSLEFLERKGRQHYKSYKKLLELEFGHKRNISLKASRMLNIPFLENMEEELNTKVILLDRERKSQVESIKRVWNNAGIRSDMTEKDISKFLDKWKLFSKEVIEYYDIESISVDFEEIINKPNKVTKRVCDFAGVRYPDMNKVKEWINPDIANRDKFGKEKGIIKRISHKLGRILIRYGEM